MRTQLAALVLALAIGLSLAAGGLQARTAGAERCPDLDHDGEVTLADVNAVADRYGTYAGGPANDGGFRYSGRYDVTLDRHIDLEDILLVLSHVGEDCR